MQLAKHPTYSSTVARSYLLLWLYSSYSTIRRDRFPRFSSELPIASMIEWHWPIPREPLLFNPTLRKSTLEPYIHVCDNSQHISIFESCMPFFCHLMINTSLKLLKFSWNFHSYIYISETCFPHIPIRKTQPIYCMNKKAEKKIKIPTTTTSAHWMYDTQCTVLYWRVRTCDICQFVQFVYAVYLMPTRVNCTKIPSRVNCTKIPSCHDVVREVLPYKEFISSKQERRDRTLRHTPYSDLRS